MNGEGHDPLIDDLELSPLGWIISVLMVVMLIYAAFGAPVGQ